MQHKMKKKNKRTKHQVPLSAKLLRTITLILAIVMLLIIFATYKGLDLVYLCYSAVSEFSASVAIEDLCETENENFFLNMDTIEREHEISVEIYSADGTFVYSSSYKGDSSLPPFNRHSIAVPIREKKDYKQTLDLGRTDRNAFNLSEDDAEGKHTEYLVGTWTLDNGVTIKIFKLRTAVEITAKIAVIFISIVTVIVLTVAAFILSGYVRHITKPLKAMSKVAKNISNLDFTHQCEPSDIEEISILSDSINGMSDSLETALVDLQQKNKKLQDDIEQEKTLDNLRQVFISGVSHELKTPIAIIQGYAEGLQLFVESDPEMAKKYSDTIMSETQRMNDLVMRLLDVTKYQSGAYKLMYESFSLYDLTDSWIERNSEILKEKGITAKNTVDKSFIAFGDSFIMSTVLNNYMSNAVSHVSGDMEITISAKENDGIYTVSVFNTGTPIAAKDIDQIWNSFYRADKAMSRAQGRFGLGLAIVAAIQKLHEQDFGVINHENGVEFWFNVKKDDNIK